MGGLSLSQGLVWASDWARRASSGRPRGLGRSGPVVSDPITFDFDATPVGVDGEASAVVGSPLIRLRDGDAFALEAAEEEIIWPFVLAVPHRFDASIGVEAALDRVPPEPETDDDSDESTADETEDDVCEHGDSLSMGL